MSTPRNRHLVPAGSASTHNKAPQPLVGPDASTRATIGLEYMSYDELETFGRELDTIRQRILDDLGQKDADYIRRVVKVQRGLEIAGRIGMYFPFLPPVWFAAVGTLGVAKIIENMEIGHNVMHGQYDWMNDPQLQGQAYDWDTVAPGEDWRRTHNFVHHTYTNIHGKDFDIGYSLIRVDADQKWKPMHLGNLVYAFVLMLVFEWGVMSHGMSMHKRLGGRKLNDEDRRRDARAKRKIIRQTLKDYVLFPALTGPFFLNTLLGNALANLIRNIWTFLIIFCGHFPAEVQTFRQEDAENETRGQWYVRQLIGSANISGSKLFHLMAGNLSHQIEHHLFPDIPSRRYQDIAPEVRALCEKYGLPYNTGRFGRQLWSVFTQIAKHSLPPKKSPSRPDAEQLPTAA